MSIASINPATGQTVRTFPPSTDADIERRLALASSAFRSWRRTPAADRGAVVARAAEILDAERDDFARLMTLEMGKTIRAAREEAAKCALACRWYAERAESLVAPQSAKDADGYVAFEPIGAVLAVMPWNFPFWQVIRFAAPALVAGNVGILKHASNVPQCALALEDLFRRAGAPDGVFQTLLVGSDKVNRIIADPRIAAVTLTGSTPAGSEVAAQAGRHIKKTVLELGGSDPFVVMASADLDAAATMAVKARVINNGQSCIAAKRFVVESSIARQFEERFVEGMKALVVGDPMDEATDVGPLATPSILNDLEEQVEESIRAGARLALGGRRLEGLGNFYVPTVLCDLPANAPAREDETFGPVAALLSARDIDDAIRLANDTDFGLGASVWTTRQDEADRLALEIEAGSVFINAMVASDPRYPFGGVKASGYGRELGAWGLREFVNVKTVRGSVSSRSGTGTESE